MSFYAKLYSMERGQSVPSQNSMVSFVEKITIPEENHPDYPVIAKIAEASTVIKNYFEDTDIKFSSGNEIFLGSAITESD